MHKSITAAVNILAAGMLLGNALAQQTPAATTPPATPAQASPAAGTAMKAQTPAAKAHTATAAKPATPLVLKTQKDKFSYALGMRMGESLHKQSVPVDPAIFSRGLRDALAGGKTQLTDDEAQAALAAVQNDIRKKQQEKMQAAAAVNTKQGEAFLAENKGKEGIVTLPSGLQYKILTAGTGPKPAATDSVSC